jgi:ATP-dependent DNA helicase RecQ
LTRPLLRGERRLELRLAPARAERRKDKDRRGASTAARMPAGDLAEADEDLLSALKTWRRELARAQGVPPYVVFHDRTLLEIAAQRPATLEALGGIIGVGQAKLARYGADVLSVLRARSGGN